MHMWNQPAFYSRVYSETALSGSLLKGFDLGQLYCHRSLHIAEFLGKGEQDLSGCFLSAQHTCGGLRAAFLLRD